MLLCKATSQIQPNLPRKAQVSIIMKDKICKKVSYRSDVFSHVNETRMSQNSESISISFHENETKSTQNSEEGESSN